VRLLDSGKILTQWNVPPAGINIGSSDKFPWSRSSFHAMEQEETYGSHSKLCPTALAAVTEVAHERAVDLGFCGWEKLEGYKP
jgi:hypothetical protein